MSNYLSIYLSIYYLSCRFSISTLTIFPSMYCIYIWLCTYIHYYIHLSIYYLIYLCCMYMFSFERVKLFVKYFNLKTLLTPCKSLIIMLPHNKLYIYDIYLSICLFIFLYVYLSFYIAIYVHNQLSIYLSIYISIYLSTWTIWLDFDLGAPCSLFLLSTSFLFKLTKLIFCH